jgi:hypothetical protein
MKGVKIASHLEVVGQRGELMIGHQDANSINIGSMWMRVGIVGIGTKRIPMTLAEIHYLEGDATKPEDTSLSKRWASPEEVIRDGSWRVFASSCRQWAVGVEHDSPVWSWGCRWNSPNALRRVQEVPEARQGACRAAWCIVHAPRIGAGRAGGEWDIIEAMLTIELVDHGIDVYIYDLPGNDDKYAFRG